MCQRSVPSGNQQTGVRNLLPNVNYFSLPILGLQTCYVAFNFVASMYMVETLSGVNLHRGGWQRPLCLENWREPVSATGPLNRTLMPPLCHQLAQFQKAQEPVALRTLAVNPTFYHLVQTPQLSSSNCAAAQIGKTPIRFTTHTNLGSLSDPTLNSQRFSNLAQRIRQ